MNLTNKSIRYLFLMFSLVFMISGCMPAIKSNVPELEARAADIKKIVLISPKVEICELSAGGVKEKRDNWCSTGEQNVEKALQQAFKEKGVYLNSLKPNNKNRKDIEEINALYRAVAYSIYNHTFFYGQNPNLFPERIENFDYSIGSVENLLKRYNADGLLIVYASDEISTKGRKALQVIQAINPFGQMDEAGVTSMVIGLTDTSGAVLWFRTKANSGGYDLRESESTQAFVRDLLSDYPGGGK
jgi:hypothetical protein